MESKKAKIIVSLHKKWMRLTGSINFENYIKRNGYTTEDFEMWKRGDCKKIKKEEN